MPVDWETLRAEFPVTRQWAFFDHAAVAPITARAGQAMAEWAADMAAHGTVHEPRWVERVEEVRTLVGRLLHADSQDIAFIKNTSEGIGIVAEGFPWKPGDNVIIAAEEYPANVYPWLNLHDRGVEVRRIAGLDGRLTVDDLRAATDARTRVVSLSAVQFASGFRNDLEAIGACCREQGIVFVVDAIQALGALPLDVSRMPVDFLSADGHKWLLGPEGAGIFYARRELVERLHPVGIGWNSVVTSRDFSRVDFHLKPHAGRWESGSLNVAGITALGASLELLLQLGIEAVARRVLDLTDELCERAGRMGLEVYSSRRPKEKSGIVSLITPSEDARTAVRRCRAQSVVINHRAGRVRVSPHCYNTPAELDRLLALLKPA